tara:strand:- start:260 stop:472 length:213 start_codon:yes stop_codon:yes gene_type:complete
MRERITEKKLSVRNSHAQALRKLRAYRGKPAYGLVQALIEGRIVELKVHEQNLESLLFTLSMMEDFNAYA